MRLSENMRGAFLMSGSMAGFALNDTALKYAGTDVGMYQSIFVRGVFAVLLIGFFAYSRGALNNLPPMTDLRRIGFRSLFEIGATLSFVTALFNMPLANITSLLQVLPLTIALAAALVLGEPLGKRRLFAIAIGFVGVLIIIRPGTAGFNAYSLCGLAAVACVTVRDLIVRQFSPAVSSLFVSFVAAVVITGTGGIGVLIVGTWTPMSAVTLVFFALAACALFLGYYCSVAAMRVGEIAFVTSYRYTVMIWAVGLGYIVFGDIPDFFTLIGMAIILATGLFTTWREQKLRTQRLYSPP